MQHQLQKQKQDTSLTSTGQSNRPHLAVINEDYPKIRDTNANDLSGLINHIIALLNIQKFNSPEEIQRMDEQMLLVGDLLRTEFGKLTIPEVKMAFKMYVTRQFPNLKVFRLLDCIAIGELLSTFIEYRNESLRTYDHKKQVMQQAIPEMSDSQKLEIATKGIIRIFSVYKATGELPEPCAWVFDDLHERKIIRDAATPAEQMYYQKQYNKALQEVNAELTKAKSINPLDHVINREVKAEIEKVLQGNSEKVTLRCKKLILADYFTKLVKENTDIQSVLS
jgi:hypothetical protein